METIGQQEIWIYDGTGPTIRPGRCSSVRAGVGKRVASYMDLATRVAELQFRNPDFVLLFRGQSADYRNLKNNTLVKPTIMRGAGRGPPDIDEIAARYWHLKEAERHLVREYQVRRLPGLEPLRRQQILRWSILQHYEICRTPLLDVTQSLRIAASFASDGATTEAFLFVLGVPQISGAITASAEAGLQIVRLASVCPPAAVRPHIQEGYLLGEYPDLSSVDQKKLYPHYEVDFGRRLIAKFRFDPSEFWKKSPAFRRVPHRALYPSDKEDPLCELAAAIQGQLPVI